MKQRKGLNVVSTNTGLIAQLYATRILERKSDSIVLNSGGWKTNHTKNCINDLLPTGYHVYQKDFKWHVVTPSGELDFTDNMEIKL